jgi:hypothetical protein
MSVFEIAFIVNGYPEPLQGLDTVEIDKDKSVATLRAEILGRQHYKLELTPA